MSRYIFSSRKIQKTARRFEAVLSCIFSHPYIKPIILFILLLCILLVLTPYLLTRTPDNHGEREKSEPPFKLAEIPKTINVYITSEDEIKTIDFEEYVKGVVEGEMPASFHMEALKAQAVAARTYSLARVNKAVSGSNSSTHPAAPLCDTTHCQVYTNDNVNKRISSAVDKTKGQLLYYDGQLVQHALFHSSSGGKTENSQDVFTSALPYLVSVESPYENEATHQNEENTFSISEVSKKIRDKYPNIAFGDINASNIEILSRSSGNHVKKMQIGAGIIEGRNLREALGLPSANFTISISGETITFKSSGSGHGVGMSQYGANGMAKKGYNYKKILSHYYSGTEVY